MKRVISLFTALALVFTLGIFLPEGVMTVFAEDSYITNASGKWYYKLNDDQTASLISFTPASDFDGALVIPSEAAGAEVTALKLNFKGNTSIKTAVMPDTITTITYASTFEDCTKLKSATISKNLTEIPTSMFKGCTSLTTVNNFSDNENITKIGGYTFYECTALTHITLPPNLTKFSGGLVFYRCGNLTSIEFPSKLTDIPSYIMHYCPNIKYVFIPEGVTGISASGLIIKSENGKAGHVPKIYGYAGSYAESYATQHSLDFTALDEKLRDIPYDVSITGGTIAYSNYQKTSFTGLKGIHNIRITADENAIPAGKVIDHWEVKTVYKAQKRYITHYPALPVRNVEKSFYLYDKDETAKCLIKDYYDSEGYDGYPKISATVTVTPVYVDKLYNLTITGGKASKTEGIKAGESIIITANTPEEGYQFKKWECVAGGVSFSSQYSASTTFTMPAGDVEVKAVFEQKPKYSVTVKNGTADKTVAYEGDTVTVTAVAPAIHKDFVHWASPDVIFKDKTAQTTTFTMPKGNVTVTAVYDDATPHTITPDVVDNNHHNNNLLASIDVSSAYAGDKVNCKVTLVKSEGAYSIRGDIKAYCGNTPITVTWESEDTVSFTMPDGDVEVLIYVNRVYVDNDYVQINLYPDKKTSAKEIGGADAPAQLAAYLECLNENGKAVCIKSGNVWTVDIDKDGSKDFTYDEAKDELTKLSTCNIKGEYIYKATDYEINAMTKLLAEKDKWRIKNKLLIESYVNSQNKGATEIDFTSGSMTIKEENEQDMLFWQAIIYGA